MAAAENKVNIFVRAQTEVPAYFRALRDDVVEFVTNFSIIKLIKSFYIADTAKRMFKAKNIHAIIYLVLNIFIICFVFYALFGGHPASIPMALILYLFSICVALSPLGEGILRKQQSCKIIKDRDVLARLEPLFLEVKERAISKQKDFVINDQIILYIKEDPDANAFAVGRRTICVTTGLLEYSDEEIKAILAHEFGHLANRDTDLTLLITVGNIIITAIVTIFKLVITLYQIIFSLLASFMGGTEGIVGRITSSVAKFLILVLVDRIMIIWTKLGIALVMKTSREAEFVADAFSCDTGYSDGLLTFFRSLEEEEGGALQEGEKKKVSLFAALSASHPETSERIKMITQHT